MALHNCYEDARNAIRAENAENENYTEKNEANTMNGTNGGITTGGYVANEMYDRMNYGRGYGAAPCSTYANQSSIQHGLNFNRQAGENQADCTRDVLGLGMDSIRQSFDAATRSREFAAQCKSTTDAEFRMMDRQRDLEREMNANARAAADCCCDTQKEILKVQAETNLRFADVARQACEDKSALMAEIKSVESRGIERDLNRAERELQTQKILVGTNNGCGVGTVPCTPCT